MRKATQDEMVVYADTKPVYPLHGFVKVDGVECAVERCYQGSRTDPKYEVMAPTGYHFDEERAHTLLCYSVSDIHYRVSFNHLEPCTDAC